ncbi:MAG: TetR/AcrR family transcriptional regulator [Jatrophihabitans sp.]|uniref:TetR/AcrR family transcriptional regulator n=1 Tax=Jatrophihabitans sp. TaxID=1932789 RepID=UPI003F8224A6
MGRSRIHDDTTAAALLAAAERLAEAEGADSITVRRLADEVGVTTRAVYSTFGSMDGLLAALGVRAFELLGIAVRRVRVTDDPNADLLRVATVAFRGFAREHAGLFRVGFASLATPPGVWAEVAPANRDAWTALLERVERVARATGLGGRSVEAAATEFHCLCEGLAVNELRGNLGSPNHAAAVWRSAFTALLAGWAAA